MDQTKSGLILGFHGCDEAVRDGIVNKRIVIRKSENSYDWLGHGYYFWEDNEERALEFAQRQKSRGKIEIPAVLGVVIDLGFCLNLMDSRFLKMVKEAFFKYGKDQRIAETPLPKNKGGQDLLLRHLDCAVIRANALKFFASINKNQYPACHVANILRLSPMDLPTQKYGNAHQQVHWT